MRQYPIYRLTGGRPVVQESEGARWAPLDPAMADAMLAVFDGLSLDAIRNTAMAAASDEAGDSCRRVA